MGVALGSRGLRISLPRPKVPALFQGPLTWEKVVQILFYLFVAAGSISLIEPSPYDFMFLVVAPLWAIGGFRLHKTLAPILFLWVVYLLAGFIALMPYLNERDPVMYEFQTLYLFCTVVFFTIYLSQNTTERLDAGLRGFTAGAIFCATIGLLAYLNIGGLGATMITEYEGRLNGTFKDPNVLGSYLILAACFLAQKIFLKSTQRQLSTFLMLLMILLAIFLSFSRGSWGATFVSMAMVFVSAFLTCGSAKLRRRMTMMVAAAAVATSIGIMGALSSARVMSLLEDRFTVTKDYDEGPNGRFGNQKRSIPMLLERPFGFGPLRFRLVFNLEPHNSYVNSFASFGWLGGFAWFTILGWTMFVGFRLMTVFSPWRQYAQVVFPALFVLLMQGFQIDIDHWRQVFLCFGAVWAMEAARVNWLTAQARNAIAGPAVAAALATAPVRKTSQATLLGRSASATR